MIIYMNNKTLVSVLLLLLLVIIPIHSQISHSHTIAVNFMQIKDELNLGLVFSGVRLEYRYGLHWRINDHEIMYQPKIGFGIGFSRIKTMECYQINIAPINVTWTAPVYNQNGHTIKAGLNFAANYNYYYWEDLHDAPLFWNSEIGLSPVIRYSYQWDNRRINASLQNSLLGFISRIQGYDPYFGVLTGKDFFVKPYTDLRFGSFNNYNHTNVSFEFIPDVSKKHSFSYEFDYLGIFYGKRFDSINHNILWRVSL